MRNGSCAFSFLSPSAVLGTSVEYLLRTKTRDGGYVFHGPEAETTGDFVVSLPEPDRILLAERDSQNGVM